jgi:DNA helicase MCM9
MYTKHVCLLCNVHFAILVCDILMVTCCKLLSLSCVFSGTVMRRWRHTSEGSRSDIELVLKANHLQVCNDQGSAVLITSETRDEFSRYWDGQSHQPLVARNHILVSICPQVCTFYMRIFLLLRLNLVMSH